MADLTNRLETAEEIDAALNSGQPMAVIGLNGRNLVQLQLPPGIDYIVLSPAQARAVAASLRKHARQSEAAQDERR